MMTRLPPLNSLRTFEAVARHLSFTGAAHELCVSTAAVSHQIRLLEDHLGAVLFRRSSRALTLTSDGAMLLPEISEAFVRIRHATSQIRRRDVAGSLTIAVPPSFATKWLNPRLPQFWQRSPALEVRVACATKLIDFADSDVDIAIRFGRGRYPGLHSEPLMAAEFFPVCSPALAGGSPRLTVPNDLRHFTLLHDEIPAALPALPSWQTWLDAAGATMVDASAGPRFDASFLTIDMAIAGKGIALALSTLAAGDLVDGRLVRPFACSLKSELAFFIVYPSTSMERPKVKAFRDWLHAEAASDPGELFAPGTSLAARRTGLRAV